MNIRNKSLPFAHKFKPYNITDPLQVYEGFSKANESNSYHTIIVDSLTYLMDMYETLYVLTSNNMIKSWGEYAQFFKRLMTQYVAVSKKNIIFTAHTMDIINETEMIQETLIKVKGSLMNHGIESYFNTVLSTKKLPIRKLEDYKNAFLNISEEDEMLGYKYVFQTRLTKETVNERIRSSLGMWSKDETFIDNDIQLVLNRIHQYYQ